MKKIYTNVKNIFESKISNGILIGIGSLIIAIIIFSAGVFVGFKKASFGRAWEQNYERNFGMKPDRPGFGKDNFPNAHGAVGKIIKIELPTIIVEGDDNTEKVILINNDTKIQKAMTNIKNTDLSLDDSVVIIGSPNNQGQIEAKFIRVMPFGMPPAPASVIPQVPIQK